MTPVPVGVVDRFVVPVRDRRAVRFLLHHLFLPHNHREWIWSYLLRHGQWLGAGESLFGAFGRLDSGPPVAVDLARWMPPELAPSFDAEEISWILLRDYPGSRARKLVFFLFRRQEREPFAVLKVGRRASRRSLRSEWNALRYLHRRLPGELAATVPTPLGFRRRDEADALLTSFVAGRTLDSELARRPAAERTLASQFESAATWLACFHITTRGDRVLTLEDPKVRLPLSASHGDFWTRNILARHRGPAVGGPKLEVSGVVDWEHFSSEAPPHEDLFHFALTYALNYPWSPYRKKSPSDAFRLGLVESTPVSRSIRAGLASYCDLTGLPFESLKPLLARHLSSPAGARYGLSADVAADALGEPC